MSSAYVVRLSSYFMAPLIALFILGAALAEPATPAGLADQQDTLLMSAVRSYGRHMSKEEAATLEKSLETQPDDLTARAKLLGYYFYQGVKLEGAAATIRARERHITWLIRNHPDSPLGGMAEATIDPSGHAMADKIGYETASAMWRALAERDNAAPQTLKNAYNFLRLHDKAEAEKIAKRANDPYLLGEIYAMGVLQVDMMNQNGLVMSTGSSREDKKYAEHAVKALRESKDERVIDVAAAFLITRGSMVQAMSRYTGKKLDPEPVPFAGELLERCGSCSSKNLYYKIRGMMSSSPEEKKQLAQQELAELEKLSSRMQSSRGQDRELAVAELDDFTDVAFRAGEYEKATDYANRILSLVEGHKLDGTNGIAAHKAHIVLGRIALQKGDVKTARKQLLAAGNVEGGATLESFGPNMALAKEMLEHGERKVVIQYLKLCKRFWVRGEGTLDKWIATINKGGMPNFGANVEY